MKKILLIFTLLLYIGQPVLSKENTFDMTTCPNPKDLVQTKNKEELIQTLPEIIAEMYGSSGEYSEWTIEVVTPMKKLSHDSKVYYQIAKNFCGKKVAKYSWFVRVRFPKLLPAESASLGELFIVKEKSGQWAAWFQYH